MAIRIVMAVILGGLIGWERERLQAGFRSYSAGFRTHILVCVGATLMMITSELVHFQFKGDAGRIAAQVVSGIGFLGAGAIMRDGLIVRGLTTAASLWVVAGVGLAVGGGYYLPATFCVFVVLFVLIVLGQLEDVWRGKRRHDVLSIIAENKPGLIGIIGSTLGNRGINIVRMQMNKLPAKGQVAIDLFLKLPDNINSAELLEELSALPGIYQAEHQT